LSETAYIGLGGNLQDPESHLLNAFDDLAALPHTRLMARSSLYRSAPVGYADQPDFINAVAQISTDLAPEPLLDALLAIERRHGRQRDFPNSPRTLDLDILLYGNHTLNTERLTVPHPRMGERAFVLLPLQELVPQLMIPGQGLVSERVAQCRDQKVCVLEQ
jgi:2-amino-4-hydroxy-6-hydroxymethyldihydropteridine diphosphokinase